MLKLDPKNTELLAQKQTVLKQNIEQSTNKLKELKKAQDLYIKSGGDLNTPAYRNLQREIISTENKLKQLKLEASKWTQMSKSLGELSSKMKTLGDSITNVGKKVSVLSAAMAGLFGAGVKYNADIETTTKAFETFLGSAEEATKAINEIKKQSETSPFDTKELIKANQYLITTGESADDSRKTISALADAISLTGGGNDELNRMAANLQQIKGLGKASAQDIKQFAYAGIDVYGILAETTGKNVEELKKMDITYQDLSKALIQASSEGGKYYNGQSQMADTLNGKISRLKKTFQDLLGELSESLMPIIDKLTSRLQDLVNYFKGLNDNQKQTITKIGLIITAAGPLLVIIGKMISFGSILVDIGSKIAGVLGKVSAGVGGISKVLTALTGPVGVVIAVISTLIGAFIHLFKTNEEFKTKVQETWQGIIELFNTYVKPIIEELKTLISNVINTIWNLLQQLWTFIEPFIQEIFTTLMDWWNDSGAEVFATIMVITKYLLQFINFLWTKVVNPILDIVINVLKPILGVLLAAITGTVNKTATIMKGVWQVIKGIFQRNYKFYRRCIYRKLGKSLAGY